MKRILTWAAIAAGSIAALFVVASALAYFLLDVDALVREQVAKQQPEIERQLGRKVEIGEVSTRFFPTLGARIDGIRVAGAPSAADEGPLLQVGSAGFDLDLLGVLLSLGTRVELDAIYLDGLRVELVRRADGTLSIADILDRPAEEPQPEEKAEGLDPAVLELLQRISIGEIRLAGAEVHLIDHAAPGGKPVESVVREIDLRLRDVRLGGDLTVELKAAAFAQKRNVDVRATVSVPADLQLDGLPPLHDVRARIDDLDLGPALPYVPLELRAAVLAADFSVPELAPAKPAEVNGFVALKGLHFEGGEPVDVRLQADLVADLKNLGAQIDQLLLRVGTVEISASGALRDLAAQPRFENFIVTSKNLDPAPLLAAFPMARASLPEGAKVQGPASLELRASGTAEAQSLNLVFDLGGVHMLLPGTFVKPAGTPFALRVEGDFTPSSAALRKANLRLDELDLDVTGNVRDFAAPVYDFSLAAKPFSVDRLVRLLPQAGEALAAADTKAAGKGALSGHLKGKPGDLSANVALSLSDVDLTLPDTTVRGGVKARIYANGNPESAIKAGLLLDAGDSIIRIPGTLQKEAATPFVIDVLADKRGERLAFEKFDVRLAELQMTAKGALGPDDAALDVALLPLDLDQFAKTVPAVPADLVKDGSVSGALQVRGNPSNQESLVVELQRLDLKLGESDLHATASVRNLAAPDITADLRSRNLDLDALMPGGEGQAEGETEAPEREDDPELKKLRAVATFDLAKLRLQGRDMQNVRGRLVVQDGVLRIEQATLGLYGGTVSATGTEAEIWRGKMPFKARLDVKNVDVAQLVAGEFDTRDLLSGRGTFQVNLDGQGFDRESLEHHLTGAWSAALQEGRLSTVSITSSVLGGLASLPGIQPQRLASEGDLRDLLAGFEVQNGRMNLQKPLKLALDGSRVELGGAVGIGGDLFLDGTYFLAPAVVSKITAGKCTIEKEAAVPLKVSGSAAKPSVQPDAKALGVLLAKACVAGKAQEAVDKLVGGQARQALDKAEDDARKAAAAAQQQVDEAKAEAQRQVDAAKAEADRKKKEAEDRAKKKAEDEAKKLRKGLGF